MKKIVILGSTGSIGTSTLDVISRFPERFKVVGLTARSNNVKLEEQIRRFKPQVVSLSDEKAASVLSKRLRRAGIEVLAGEKGTVEVARMAEGELVVSGMVGGAGLLPTFSAIQSGKSVALANKETLVMAGEIIQREAELRKVRILPIDSEHSAIFQVMASERPEAVRRIILTASGGPLLRFSNAQRRAVTPQIALAHPTWKMGPKISIDSATLMNKGFEIMEARWLFGAPPEKIDVIIHPQSIIHSMVEFIDRSVVAQMGLPDMRVPISYALHYPERAPLSLPSLSLEEIGQLTFEKPNLKAFPLLGCAYEALKTGGSVPAVLNAANEEGVEAFLSEKIGFLDIYKVIRNTLDAHLPHPIRTLEDVLSADRWARVEAQRQIGKYAA
ncbi:MAG: 1-deoxy-D-xylulose-5-phosphate reductoisomerase [Nitrospirae bacterium]|nr:1-deoxy-D-xylulose-5-phosphate reductoisomerase [Candidatus Manganitrophaceae bacterium]